MNLKGYNLSRDYALLCQLMRTQTIICAATWAKQPRHLGKSLFESNTGGDGSYESAGLKHYYDTSRQWERFQVISPGNWIIDASTTPEFIEQCQRMNLEFVMPTDAI